MGWGRTVGGVCGAGLRGGAESAWGPHSGRSLRGGAGPRSGRGPVLASRCSAGATPLATGKETRTLGGPSGGTAGILCARFLLPVLAV